MVVEALIVLALVAILFWLPRKFRQRRSRDRLARGLRGELEP